MRTTATNFTAPGVSQPYELGDAAIIGTATATATQVTLMLASEIAASAVTSTTHQVVFGWRAMP
jgi:hypothetical protein